MSSEAVTATSTGVPAGSTKPRKFRGFTIFLLVTLIGAVFFALNFHTVEVKGRSMFPTLKEGRRVLVSHALWLVGQIKVGDIVVLREEDGKGYFIKRVLGLPGDQIEWALAPRNYSMKDGKYVVPGNSLYVVGDNLPESEDSRRFGPVPMERLLGKVVVAR